MRPAGQPHAVLRGRQAGANRQVRPLFETTHTNCLVRLCLALYVTLIVDQPTLFFSSYSIVLCITILVLLLEKSFFRYGLHESSVFTLCMCNVM